MTDDQLYSATLQAALLACAIVAVVTTAKRVAVALLGPTVLCGKVAQVLLRIAPLMLGAMGGMADGFFDGYPAGPRALLGLVAGFASPTIYRLVASRLPHVMGSKGASWRQGGDGPPGGPIEPPPPEGGEPPAGGS